VIAAPIAPTEKGRQAVKNTIQQSAGPGGNFFLIHVATPLEHAEQMDRRGIYKRARDGTLKGLPGVDVEYEGPSDADLVVDATEQSIPEIVHGKLFGRLPVIWTSADLFTPSYCASSGNNLLALT
jgi:sulfate adenylyltransferase